MQLSTTFASDGNNWEGTNNDDEDPCPNAGHNVIRDGDNMREILKYCIRKKKIV